MWNRFRYTLWSPVYDAIVGAAGFAEARRRSITQLNLRPGDRVLLVGAGTGLDLDYLPGAVEVAAIDVTPAMLNRLEARAARRGIAVNARAMDARNLQFPNESFDAVVMHLILAVMPEPERGLAEAERVLKPGGRVAVFDKFLQHQEKPSLKRRLLNVVAKPLFSDLNRQLEPLVSKTRLAVAQDEPVGFGGAYRIVSLVKSAAGRADQRSDGARQTNHRGDLDGRSVRPRVRDR
jgi:ubiquinone/menaquinone biosynthesis C-methylase UbiE